MKKILVLCAALALFAIPAFAQSGADLTVVACPTSTVGPSGDAGTLDCAGGQLLTLLVTFVPAEAITDLVGINFLIDVGVNGNLSSTANFWDLAVNNAGALNGSQARPASPTGVCSAYTATWNQSGAGFGAGAAVRSSSDCRIAGLCYRPGNLSVTAGQKLFGAQVTIDGSTSTEAGGTGGSGCTLGACFVLNELDPGSASNAPVTNLQHQAVFGNSVTVNGGGSLCGATPTQRHTWGQLKSMYR